VKDKFEIPIAKLKGFKLPGSGGWTIWILEREDGMVQIELIWLRIGTSGGLL
jgi:hypothetical protein